MAKRRKPGSGNQIGDHLWEGRYSPGGPDGKQSSWNVYGHTPEECEEKLRVLIAAMKAKKETPADAGVFLSVVFLWSIKNSKNLEHCKCTKKLQKAKKLMISQEIRTFWLRRQDSNLRPPGYEAVSRANRSHFGSDLCFLPPFARRIFRCFRPSLPAFFVFWVKTGSDTVHPHPRCPRLVWTAQSPAKSSLVALRVTRR